MYRALQYTTDRRANLRFVAGVTRLDWSGAHDQSFLKLDVLAEERQNGTALTSNSCSLGTLSAHYSHELPRGVVSVLAWRTQDDGGTDANRKKPWKENWSSFTVCPAIAPRS